MKTYRVVVTREGRDWLARVEGLPGAHTYARNLVGLDQATREAIALVEDLPDGAESGLDLVWDYRTGDEAVDTESARVRAERARIAAQDRQVVADTNALIVRLVESQRYSARDAARLAGVSQQRVSQVMQAHLAGRVAAASTRTTRPRRRTDAKAS